MMNNTGKFALVTAASSGIGYQLAKLFAKNGYNLSIVGRNAKELEVKAAELSKTGLR